jgi:hypothetical protein
VKGSLSCVEASFGNADPLIGQVKHCECWTFTVPDMSFEIHPANVPASTEIGFSASPDSSCIIQYKYTFDIVNSVALSLLTKEATAPNLEIASSFTLIETAPQVKIGFAFVGTDVHHNLVGVHDMTLAVSLKDFSEFDYFLKVEF